MRIRDIGIERLGFFGVSGPQGLGIIRFRERFRDFESRVLG